MSDFETASAALANVRAQIEALQEEQEETILQRDDLASQLRAARRTAALLATQDRDAGKDAQSVVTALEARLASLPDDGVYTEKLRDLRALEADLRQEEATARRVQGEAKAREIATQIEAHESEIAEAKARYEAALDAGRAYRRKAAGGLAPWPELAYQARQWQIEPARELSPTAQTLDAALAYLDALIAHAPDIERRITGEETTGALTIEWRMLNDALGFVGRTGELTTKRAALARLRSRVN